MTATDHITRMTRRLSTAFNKNTGTNLEKLLATMADEMVTLEGVGAAVIMSHQWDHATAESLDNMAATFEVSRDPGSSDVALREKVATILWQNRSCGTTADIKAIVAFICGVDPESVTVLEPEAAHISITISEVWSKSFSLAGLYDAINKTKAGGVLFLDDQTVFILDEALITMIGNGYHNAYWTSCWGWGWDAWGLDPWGGSDTTKMDGHSEIIPLP